MRKKRFLVQNAWYEVRAAINNREPLFRRRQAIAIFCRVFGEVRGCFAFELRGLALVEERLSFYIRPMDGLQLPAIMQWVKQTFAVRFNRRTKRTGHIWGDRYWSQVLTGEPPEWAVEVDWEAVEVAAETGVSSSGVRLSDGVSPRSKTPQEHRHKPPPQRRQGTAPGRCLKRGGFSKSKQPHPRCHCVRLLKNFA
jgi:hypothetical protein